MNMMKDQEQRRSPGGGGDMLAKLRERLREKDDALQVTPPATSRRLPKRPELLWLTRSPL